MTRLEALCLAHDAAARVAGAQGITVTELMTTRSKAAVEGRRMLTAELLPKMSIKLMADVLGLSAPGVKGMLGPRRPPPQPKTKVWCVAWDNELVPAETYKKARRYCLEVRARGIAGAYVQQVEVGDA